MFGTELAGAGERRGDDYNVMAQVLDDITTQATSKAGITPMSFGNQERWEGVH